MKQAVSFIKKFLLFAAIWVCVFQGCLLLFGKAEKCNIEEENMKELDALKKDTEYIINANPSVCMLIRDDEVKNSDGEVISYNRIEKDDVVVRLSLIGELQEHERLHGSNDVSKKFILTAKYDEDIKRGDVLKTNAGFFYKVKDIQSITLGGKGEEFCYKKSGVVEWLVL